MSVTVLGGLLTWEISGRIFINFCSSKNSPLEFSSLFSCMSFLNLCKHKSHYVERFLQDATVMLLDAIIWQNPQHVCMLPLSLSLMYFS